LTSAVASPLAQLGGRRLLVTGGTGFVGQHVVRLALSAGAEVHVLGRRAPGEVKASFHMADLADPGGVTQVLREVQPDCIVHLAAAGVAYGSSDAAELRRINTTGLAGLLEAAVSLSVPPAVVCAGSGFEYAPAERPLREDDPIGPSSDYGASKAAAFAVAAGFGARLPLTWVRLFSLYGPEEKEPRLAPYVIGCVRRGQPVELTAGEQVRDYTSVVDAAEALLRASVQPPAREMCVVNFASESVVTLREFVQVLADQLAAHGLCPVLKFGAKPYRSNEMMHYSADIERWKSLFGWQAQRTLAQGLSEMLKSAS
jgi:nucleoside-diphosphate-sugar epimerase